MNRNNEKMKWINEKIKNAIKQGDNESLKLMISHGIDIKLHDKHNPLVVEAAGVSTPEILRFLHQLGADINAVNHVGSSALERAVGYNKIENVQTLIELGIDINIYGGGALRYAAWKGNKDIVDLLLKQGANINYRQRDTVFSNCPTPIISATQMNHFDVVNYLIANGADLIIKDKYGERPYTIAKKNKNKELMELIRQNEPSELVSKEIKIEELKKAKLPVDVIHFLCEKKQKIELPMSKCTNYVEFYEIEDIPSFDCEGRQVFALISEVQGYDSGTGFLIWIPDFKKFGSFDAEHSNFMVIHDMTWKEFRKRPEYFVDRILEGFYDDI